MKSKLKTLGVVALSTIGMLVLFIVIIGIGNYFQNNVHKHLGNAFIILFPVTIYFAVKIFNLKINSLTPENYGFDLRKFGLNFLLGVGLAIVAMAVILLISYPILGVEFTFSGLKEDFGNALIKLILTLLVVGVWEEFYFRGLIFNTLLKNDFGFHLSAFISSVFFSLVHWSSFDMSVTSKFWYLGIVFMGYILVYIYTYTKSIWSVVSFHFIWNVLATMMDEEENGIGIFSIAHYEEVSINLDRHVVVCLGVILLIMIFIHRKNGSKHVDGYIQNIEDSNEMKARENNHLVEAS